MKCSLFLGLLVVLHLCLLSATEARRTSLALNRDSSFLNSTEVHQGHQQKMNNDWIQKTNKWNHHKKGGKHNRNKTKSAKAPPVAVKYYIVVNVADGDTATVKNLPASSIATNSSSSNSTAINSSKKGKQIATTKVYHKLTTTTKKSSYMNKNGNKKYDKYKGKKTNKWEKRTRVRFVCIDAPEKSQGKWGTWSLTNMSALLPVGTKVGLIGSKLDQYNRTVAELINHKGVNVNKKLVEMGLAVHYRFQRGCDEYRVIEKKAKKAKKGVWSDPKFEMPWDYRKKNGIGARGKEKGSRNHHDHKHEKNNKHHHDHHDRDQHKHKNGKNRHGHHKYKHENALFPTLPAAATTKKSGWTTKNAWSTHKP